MYELCGVQVQSALRRRFAQSGSQWRRRRLVTTDSHCNYHTNSSITENSRVTISLDHEKMHTLNGQSNGRRRSHEEHDRSAETSEM